MKTTSFAVFAIIAAHQCTAFIPTEKDHTFEGSTINFAESQQMIPNSGPNDPFNLTSVEYNEMLIGIPYGVLADMNTPGLH